MTITATVKNAIEATKVTSINHTDDAASPAAASYKLGYVPRYVCVMNVTDRIRQEYFVGMAANNFINTTAAGTTTLATSGGLAVSGDTITFPVVQNKLFCVLAEG